MSENVMGIFLLFGLLAFFMIIRVPIAFSLGLSAVFTAIFMDVNLFLVFQQMASSLQSFTFLAVPFFILCASIMTEAGISDKLMNFSRLLVGRVRGGTAMVNVVVSMFFGGISGSSVADVASIGPILIPAMVKEGYDKDYSTAVTVTASVQGIIIPPSQNMIYYAIAAGGVSISEMFIGGYIPGILLGVTIMAVAYVIAVKRNYPKGTTRYTFKEGTSIMLDASVGLFTMVIIIGGILFGVFTPTESAAVASVYAIIVSMFYYKTITLSKLVDIMRKSVSTLATVMAIIAMSSAFGYLLTYLQVPTLISTWMLSISENPVIIMLMINIFLLFAGCFMDMGVLILLLTPIFFPIVTQVGYDPIHFGIIMILNLGIGLCTPPVGTSLFVGCAVADLPIEKAVKAFIPFYIAMIVLLIVIIMFPQLCLWLPSKMS